MPIMRTIRVLPFLVIAMTLHLCAASMTDQDREHLLVHFEMTGQMLAEEVRGLSPDPAGIQSVARPLVHSGMRLSSRGR